LSTPKNKVYDIFDITNPAWTNNEKIRNQMGENCKVVASIINFEHAYFSEIISTNKPEHCISTIKSVPEKYALIKQLLDSLLGLNDASLPEGAVEWSNLSELEALIPEVTLQEEAELI